MAQSNIKMMLVIEVGLQLGGFGLKAMKLMFKKKISEVLCDRGECDQVSTAEH